MKLLIVVLALATLASAESVKSFQTRPVADQAKVVSGFIEKFTADIARKNPDLADDMRAWFVVKPAGQPVSEGVRKLSAEIGALAAVAREGKADLDAIQIEGVIMKVVREKFPPNRVYYKPGVFPRRDP